MSDPLTIVRKLNESGSVLLVRDQAGTALVRKDIPHSAVTVYHALQRQPSLHFPQIAEISAENGSPYVLMQYLEGNTLEDLLDQGHHFDESETVAVALQLCDILSKLHALGIVHRDLKPANILLRPDSTVILLDFDISRFVKDGARKDTVLLGTEGYAAPEQFGFAQSDARTDLYSLGVLLNVLLTGAFPNEFIAGGTLGKIIRKCTSIDAADRFQTASELKTALLRVNRKPEPAPQSQQQSEPFLSGGFLRKIPGFRSGRIWKMVLAVTVYLFAAFIFGVGYNTQKKNLNGTLIVTLLLVYVLGIYSYAFDLFRIRKRSNRYLKVRNPVLHHIVWIAGFSLIVFILLLLQNIF